MVGENGHGDEFGIGSEVTYSGLEVANLFGGKVNFLPERKGNRMDAKIVTKKTKKLGWESTHDLKNHIEELKIKNWIEK